MLSLTEIQKKLSDRNLSEVARRLGVTRSWLASIAKGAKPSDEFQAKLSEYLEGKDDAAV